MIYEALDLDGSVAEGLIGLGPNPTDFQSELLITELYN
jgi:hypothetical protein